MTLSLSTPNDRERIELDAATLGRPAAVVRDRRDVADQRDLQADDLERAERALAAGARALHEHRDRAHAVLRRLARCLFGSELRGERRALARALEAARAGARPGDHVALMSVMVTIVLLNVDWMCAMPVETFFLTFFLAALASALATLSCAGDSASPDSGHAISLSFGELGEADCLRDSTPLRGPLRVRALVCVR